MAGIAVPGLYEERTGGVRESDGGTDSLNAELGRKIQLALHCGLEIWLTQLLGREVTVFGGIFVAPFSSE